MTDHDHTLPPGTTLDHVAVAVADPDAAVAWWTGIGARQVSAVEASAFAARQLRLANHGTVELLSPAPGAGTSFVDGFLDRFGSGMVHHITLKVPAPLEDSVRRLQQAGLDVVDVDTDDPHWHESFLRPSQVGGVIVQVAWASGSVEEFAARAGQVVPRPPDHAAPALQRVVLGHPDLDAAAEVWRILGGDITRADGRVQATWPGAAVAVEVRQAAAAGPLGLVLGDRGPQDRTDVAPALLAS